MDKADFSQLRIPGRQPLTAPTTVAAVVIGRNEERWLRDCLCSVSDGVARTIYVDSGSLDASVEIARRLGAEVIELNPELPFSAARARNEGLKALASDPPDFVQFIDGDCTLRNGWISIASTFLSEHPQAAVVCGRRRERRPEASVFNEFCDREWDTPLGEVRACGGDALMRYHAVAQVGGFRDDLIAGEEPELCVRLRGAGWKVWRVGSEMTWHDANIAQLGPWLRRTRRAGYAFAQGAALHGRAPEYHWVAETRRALIWGYTLPLSALALAALHPAGMLLLLAYPAQIVRLASRDGIGRRMSWQRGFYLTLGKFPEALGVLHFRLNRLLGRRSSVLEYK